MAFHSPMRCRPQILGLVLYVVATIVAKNHESIITLDQVVESTLPAVLKLAVSWLARTFKWEILRTIEASKAHLAGQAKDGSDSCYG